MTAIPAAYYGTRSRPPGRLRRRAARPTRGQEGRAGPAGAEPGQRGPSRREAGPAGGRAGAEIGLRFATRQTEQAARAAVRGLTPVRHGARVAAEILSSRPAWPATAVNPLAGHVIALAAGLGERLGARPAGGAGDTNFTAAAGLPTVDGLGPRGRGAHSPAESVRVDASSTFNWTHAPRRPALTPRPSRRAARSAANPGLTQDHRSGTAARTAVPDR